MEDQILSLRGTFKDLIDRGLITTVIPNSALKSFHLLLEGPEHLYFVCLSVRPSVCLSVCLPVHLSVAPAVSGVRRAEEQQKIKFSPTYSVRLTSIKARGMS